MHPTSPRHRSEFERRDQARPDELLWLSGLALVRSSDPHPCMRPTATAASLSGGTRRARTSCGGWAG